VELVLTNDNINEVQSFLHIHGDSIEMMNFDVALDLPVEGDVFVAMLRRLPNLKKLTIHIKKANILDYQTQSEVILPKLKDLEFYTSHSFINILNLIPENTIMSLEVTAASMQGFEIFMERQSQSVVNLGLHYENLNSSKMFQKMKLKSFTVLGAKFKKIGRDVLKIINEHSELELLHDVFPMSGDLAKALLGLKHLKDIDLFVTDENWEEILHAVGRSQVKVSKMFLLGKNLKVLLFLENSLGLN
jgi:hypothetical protein